MITNEKILYQKAYKELYCVIQILTEEEKNKIPIELIENIKKNMNSTYDFFIDKDKSILEQNLMPQTQALIIEIYQKYLAPEEDKVKWEKYNQICYQKSEQEKRKKYNPENLFKVEKVEMEEKQINSSEQIIVKNKSFIKRIIEKIKLKFSFKQNK